MVETKLVRERNPMPLRCSTNQTARTKTPPLSIFLVADPFEAKTTRHVQRTKMFKACKRRDQDEDDVINVFGDRFEAILRS